MLNPASKMMGGSSQIMKNSKSNFSFSSSPSECATSARPEANMPTSTPMAASGSQCSCGGRREEGGRR